MGLFTNNEDKVRTYGIVVAEPDWMKVAEVVRKEYKKDSISVYTKNRPDGNGGTEAIVTIGFQSTLNEFVEIVALCGERGIKLVKKAVDPAK